MNYHYSSPPKGYTPYYDSSPTLPYIEDSVYYAPQRYESPQAKRHERKYSYTATRPGGWHSAAGYPSPKYYEGVSDYKASPHKEVYVSTTKRDTKSRLRSYSVSGGRENHTMREQEQPIYIHDGVDDAYHIPQYLYHEPNPKARHTKKPIADQDFYFYEEQIHDKQVKRSRARRSSTTTRIRPKPTKSSYTRSPPKATEEDATRAGIPSGYSIKNWDPTESPIVLLGSVFDANSLGKWIYDWTVYHHGSSTPMADVAGDLWLLLIKLAGKMKRAGENVEHIRSIDSQEIAEDFVGNGGNRLWQKFKQLLKECDQYMWRAARQERWKRVPMAEECARHIRSSNSQGMMEDFLEGYHHGGLYTKLKTLLRRRYKPIVRALTELSQSLWNEVGRTIPDACLHQFTSPLYIPIAKVLPIMFAFCTPVSARPIDADIAISEHWKLGASKFDWDAILTPDTVLCLITLMLEVICVVIVSYKARNEPCSTYGFFAILFGVVVILISDDSRIPMAVAGPTIAVGGYFCARYGLAQSRLNPVNGQRYASMMLLTGVFLDCAAAHTFGVDGLEKGGLVQWSLLTFWLSISLWPYLARLLDFSRNDLTV